MKKSNFIFGAVLIVVGALLIARNLGYIDFNLLWLVGRSWPLLLVGIGVSLLLGKRVSGLIILGIFLLIMAVGLAGFYWYDREHISVSGTSDVSDSVEGVRLIEYDIDAAAVVLKLVSDDKSLASVDYKGYEPIVSYDKSGSTREVKIKQPDRYFFTGGVKHMWDVAINDKIPADLDIDVGVAGATIDLSDVELEKLDLDGGVGSIKLTLGPNGAKRRVITDLDLGIGELVLRLPKQAAVLVHYEKGIGGSNLVKKGFDRNGNSYYSSLWQSNTIDASVMYEIRVESGIGELEVEWYDADK